MMGAGMSVPAFDPKVLAPPKAVTDPSAPIRS
jgi:hypothetical protein